MTKEQLEQQILDDYSGKPYALIGAVVLGIIVMTIAGTTGFIYLLEIVCK